MTPPVESFPASQLKQRVESTADGRSQKGQIVDLRNCELLEMVQYSCRLRRDPGGEAMISCKPIMRLFRRWVTTVLHLPYNLGFLTVYTNVKLINCPGAKMIYSWKRVLSEKGVDDGVMQVYRRCSLV